jgi:hypothetical protein
MPLRQFGEHDACVNPSRRSGARIDAPCTITVRLGADTADPPGIEALARCGPCLSPSSTAVLSTDWAAHRSRSRCTLRTSGRSSRSSAWLTPKPRSRATGCVPRWRKAGSPFLTPGEISLAHGGILFADELPEFARGALEALREPLETARITISRAARQALLPARSQLVAANDPLRLARRLRRHGQDLPLHVRRGGPIQRALDGPAAGPHRPAGASACDQGR